MKHKVLFLFVAAMLLLFAGCNKDAFFDESTDVVLKKANVPIPLKGETCMTSANEERLTLHFGSPDGPVIPGGNLAKTAWLRGNLTHMGKLDEQSFMTGREGAYLDAVAFSQGKKIVYATYDARIFAANGDYIDIVSNIRIDQNQKTITGEIIITGGSERFENAAGGGSLSGAIPCWDVDGTLEFPRE